MNQAVQPSTITIPNTMTAVNPNAQPEAGSNMLVANPSSVPQSVVIATQSGPQGQIFLTQNGQQIQFVNQNASRPPLQTIQHSGAIGQVGNNIIFTNATGPSNQRTVAPQVQQQFVQIPNNIKISQAGTTILRTPGINVPALGGQRQMIVKPENGTMQFVSPNFVKIQTSNRPQLQQIPSGAVRSQLVGQNILQLPVLSAPGQQGHNRAIVQGSQPQAMIVATSQTNNAPNATTTVPISTTAGIVAAATVPAGVNTPHMTPSTATGKCKNFFSTLIRLANDQGEGTSKNVTALIQSLVDDTIKPEEFTTSLQKELQSSEQPCLMPFLKRSLPYLRYSLMHDEMTIEGIRKPPSTAHNLPSASPLPNVHSPINTVATPPIPSSPQTRFVRLMQPPPGGLISGQQILTPIQSTTPNGPILINPQSLNAPNILGLPPGTIPARATLSAPSPRLPNPQPPPPPPPPTTTANISEVPKPTTKAATTPKPKSASSAKKAKPKKEPVLGESSATKSTFKDDDDYNDVAAMGGVNLIEESQKIMAANSEMIGQQIRSCKDETFLPVNTLHQRVIDIMKRFELADCSPDVVVLLSHAVQERMKTIVQKLSCISEHRQENLKMNNKYTVVQDIKGQVQFLQELDRIEKKKHEEQEREVLFKAAKSRSKMDDPDLAAMKARAKEMHRQEQEEIRQKEANETAMRAIGKKRSGNFAGPTTTTSILGSLNSSTSSTQSNNSTFVSNSKNFSSSSAPIKKIKRVIMKDVHFLLEHERDSIRSTTLYKALSK